MLWIFKFARWTPDRCTKKERKAWLLAMASELHPLRFEQHRSFVLWDLNSKFGSVAYRGHPNKLVELHLWSFKLDILQSWLPCRYPKTWHSDADISDLGLFYFLFLFLHKKTQNLLDIQEHCIRKLVNLKWAETFAWCLLLIFKVVYRDHLTQLLPFAWDFVTKGQRLVRSQVG